LRRSVQLVASDSRLIVLVRAGQTITRNPQRQLTIYR